MARLRDDGGSHVGAGETKFDVEFSSTVSGAISLTSGVSLTSSTLAADSFSSDLVMKGSASVRWSTSAFTKDRTSIYKRSQEGT